MNKIEIPLSKTKTFILLVGALTFAIIATLFIINPDNFISPIIRNTLIIRIVGVAGVIFFGVAGIYGTSKLFDNRIGLTVDENGIIDNTNASSVGLIKWSDITAIKTQQVASTKFLLIYTSNPDYYLKKVRGFKRKLMQGNNKKYGTPLSITSNTLKYNFDDLERLLNNRFNAETKRMPGR